MQQTDFFYNNFCFKLNCKILFYFKIFFGNISISWFLVRIFIIYNSEADNFNFKYFPRCY